jgi:hypothetical protein
MPKKARKAHAKPRASNSTLNTQQATTRILWQHALRARWGLSKQTFWRYRRAKKIPEPDFHIGEREGWTLKTVEAFEASAGARQ